MESLTKKVSKGILMAMLVLPVACDMKEEHIMGNDPGAVNREDPTIENRDETGDGFTREYEDGTAGAEVGPSPGADSTNTDSTSLLPRMGR